ncbi:MAG: hypothetical protein KDJ16_02385 [Hyphomicrobiales bacterium]|nr:hypothetical protein [Hyphomicrobiales bacterium]
MTADKFDELAKLLAEVRAYLARPNNRFEWSGWNDVDDALAEFDAIAIAIARYDEAARARLQLYFAPTGPIQEVSLSSGWGDEFLALARRADKLL